MCLSLAGALMTSCKVQLARQQLPGRDWCSSHSLHSLLGASLIYPWWIHHGQPSFVASGQLASGTWQVTLLLGVKFAMVFLQGCSVCMHAAIRIPSEAWAGFAGLPAFWQSRVTSRQINCLHVCSQTVLAAAAQVVHRHPPPQLQPLLQASPLHGEPQSQSRKRIAVTQKATFLESMVVLAC